MNKLEEYILRYRELHDGTAMYASASDPTIQKVNKGKPGKKKVLFDGSQLGKKLPPFIQKFINNKGKAVTLLDYGCGRAIHNFTRLRDHGNETYTRRTLIERFEGMIQCYYCFDPAVQIYDEKPPQGMIFDIVCCADVMEHIPEDFVESVLREIFAYTKTNGVAMFTISGNPALKTFNDGENLHTTIKQVEWWLEKIQTCSDGKSFLLFHNDESKPDQPVQFKYHNSTELTIWNFMNRKNPIKLGKHPCEVEEV